MLYKSEVAVVNQSGAMEADTTSKNGRSLKSQMSRRNILIALTGNFRKQCLLPVSLNYSCLFFTTKITKAYTRFTKNAVKICVLCEKSLKTIHIFDTPPVRPASMLKEVPPDYWLIEYENGNYFFDKDNILKKCKYDLPKIPSYTFNERVKELGQRAKLKQKIEVVRKKGKNREKKVFEKWEMISSHTCRRSFCTNMYLSGFPAEELMRISGHKSPAAFMRYIKVDIRYPTAILASKWWCFMIFPSIVFPILSAGISANCC